MDGSAGLRIWTSSASATEGEDLRSASKTPASYRRETLKSDANDTQKAEKGTIGVFLERQSSHESARPKMTRVSCSSSSKVNSPNPNLALLPRDSTTMLESVLFALRFEDRCRLLAGSS